MLAFSHNDPLWITVCKWTVETTAEHLLTLSILQNKCVSCRIFVHQQWFMHRYFFLLGPSSMTTTTLLATSSHATPVGRHHCRCFSLLFRLVCVYQMLICGCLFSILSVCGCVHVSRRKTEERALQMLIGVGESPPCAFMVTRFIRGGCWNPSN